MFSDWRDSFGIQGEDKWCYKINKFYHILEVEIEPPNDLDQEYSDVHELCNVTSQEYIDGQLVVGAQCRFRHDANQDSEVKDLIQDQNAIFLIS
jgi:hypothetical protein